MVALCLCGWDTRPTSTCIQGGGLTPAQEEQQGRSTGS